MLPLVLGPYAAATGGRGRQVRALIALGGNAMTGPDGEATVEAQERAIATAMDAVADLVAGGVEVVLTHGNGPQVGNLLVKNELAASVVPPVPLDWCGAQTQATIGFLVLDALEASLAARGCDRRVAALVTRTLVDPDDPGFQRPTKPVGRSLPKERAQALVAHGETWEDRGEQGWRRVVASPEPLEVLDAPAVLALLAAGFVVVAAGGGGILHARQADGSLHGVGAVLDKDLPPRCWRARPARTCWSSPPTSSTRCSTSAPSGPCPSAGSHPASCGRTPPPGSSRAGAWDRRSRPWSASWSRAVITSLDRIASGVAGEAGTVVEQG